MLWVERIGDRRSYVILAQNFLWKTGDRHIGMARGPSRTRSRGKVGGSGGLSQPYIPSIVERASERPGAVKGTPFFRRGASEPLTARTALKRWRGEGKDDTPRHNHNNFDIPPERSPSRKNRYRRGEEKSCFIFVTEVH